jgi:hypothetical protein
LKGWAHPRSPTLQLFGVNCSGIKCVRYSRTAADEALDSAALDLGEQSLADILTELERWPAGSTWPSTAWPRADPVMLAGQAER